MTRTRRSSSRLSDSLAAARGLRIGVDAGGTFTDSVAERPDGTLVFSKLPSTPEDPGAAVAAGERSLAGGDPVDVLTHGSTVGTNAFLEGLMAPVGLVVPRGFEDVIAIGRQRRRGLHSLSPEGSRKLVPERLVRGIGARVSAGGATVAALDPAELETAAAELVQAGARAIVVALLHSARHPAMESDARERLTRAGIPAIASHDVSSEPREYERWATAVIDAALAPVVGAYVAKLGERLSARELRIMLSSGGTATASAAAARPVSTLLSGPAAGVVGARLAARLAGFERIVTFDMGGTSCDVALVPGEPVRTTEAELEGVPIHVPIVDIRTVGAGGGSVLWKDAGGALRVGPRSAGAVPGPACYGAGGTRPTLTDAHLLLGHLDPARFLGGRRPLAPALAERALAGLARELGSTTIECAAAAVRIADAGLERAVRAVTVERGHDPADHTLVAFGGAGGLHAPSLAESLGCRRVLVPRAAGTLSALGCLAADVRRDLSRAILEPVDESTSARARVWLAELEREAEAELAGEGVPGDRRRRSRSLALRYRGQSYEIEVPAEGDGDVRDRFHRAHAERYGYARPGAEVELVAARVAAVGEGRAPRLPSQVSSGGAPWRRPVRFEDRVLDAEAWRWADLHAATSGTGPTVVFDDYATALVPPGWGWSVDDGGNLLLEATG